MLAWFAIISKLGVSTQSVNESNKYKGFANKLLANYKVSWRVPPIQTLISFRIKFHEVKVRLKRSLKFKLFQKTENIPPHNIFVSISL